MRPFNLAETRITERDYCKLVLNRRIRVMILIIILTVMVAVTSYACRLMIIGKATNVKTDLANAQNRYLNIKREIADTKSVTSQYKWQNQLSAASSLWINTLNSVFCRLPDGVWLDRVETEPKDSALNVDGHADSFETLSKFTQALRSSRIFSDVRIMGTKVNNSNGSCYIDFSLSVKTKGASVKQASTNTVESPGKVPEIGEQL